MQTPEVSVIIVAYNSENFIERCIRSVLKYEPNCELIVFDNNSSDKTIDRVKLLESRVKIIESDVNLGFARANNNAVKMATGNFLFFLNPDTELTMPVVNKLIEFYEITPNVGLIAPKLEMVNGKIQTSVRKLPTVFGAFKEFILGMKGEYSEYVPGMEDPTEVEMVYGAAILIKKDLFEKLGGFDGRYFLYYEDIDLCRRVRQLGKKVYFHPKVTIKHLLGGTGSEVNKYELNLKSARIYHGLIGSILLQSIFLIRKILNKT